jgi:hypothetical protein
MSARVVAGRCLVLIALIESVGFKTKKNDKGIGLEGLLNLVGIWLNTAITGDARTSVLHVLHAILGIVSRQKFEDIVEGFPINIQKVLMTEANGVRGVVIDHHESVMCEFCNKSDPSFISQDVMDLHYWEKCPALIECRFCEQIVEVVALTEHRLKECEAQREARIYN